MPQETDRLKLPLPLGNETVNRESINGIFEKIDAGVATQADLDALREAVSKMDIPDASLTQKGKVQLSSKTDGTSETMAATEKAVSDARVTAISAASTDATIKAKSYVDAKSWQKHKLTQDSGISINASNGNANLLVTNGDYVGENIANTPRAATGEWWYIRVSAMAAGVWVKQEAINLFTNTYQMRTGSDAGGGVLSWGPWTADVFQSGVDAKNGIVGAINAKGGSASTNDTWAQLSAKVQAIQTGLSLMTGKVSAAGGRIDIPGYRPQVFILHSIESRNSQLWYDSFQNRTTAWIYSFGPLVAFRYPETNNTKLLDGRGNVTFSNYSMFTGAGFRTLAFGDGYVEFATTSSGDGYISQEQTEYTILAIPV
ncbi:tail fiber protein [Paenibacillus sp. QZ-Y1]|uniref:tail fiber protein n=1 Tax=Paenibacillus sp. QZ-Y1 TaxID=3414511 RepID=UPI003F79FA02